MSTITSLPTEIRDHALLQIPGAQEHLTDLDTAILQLMEKGADPELLKSWLIDAVDLLDSATPGQAA